MRVYLSPPDVGEAERTALLAAFDGGWIAPAGPDIAMFEDDLATAVGWPGVVVLSSGTAALHLALLAVGVTPGSRVFVSSFTFAATANAVVYCGAEPVFIDSEPHSWNMDPMLLEDALRASADAGELPSAVVVVDLYGQCADYASIMPICARYGVPVVEDAAEALLARHHGRSAGTLGDIGVISFNGNKIMTTGGGGALLTPDRAVADRARYLATQARQPVLHYEHVDIGFNYRMSNLLAALGRAQLARLPSMIEARRSVNARYRERLGGLDVGFMPVPEWNEWNGWLTCVTFPTREVRDRVIAALAAVEIESRPLWKPMHLQPVFAAAESWVNGVSEGLFDVGLCLPSGSALTAELVDEVCSIVAAQVR